ncbi:hypothetical protein ACFC1I_15810 [Microbacterium sp. NPDC056044]|uniref:hypothetical protein n=1 Tax=Microbacterium sp. NPDC056044 TaxID=3345690 RepID=UPI0035D95BED
MTASATRPALAAEGTITLPASAEFVVSDAVRLGRTYGDFTVTYVGPNFLRLFGSVTVAAQPERSARFLVLDEWTDDAALDDLVRPEGSLADLFAALALGPEGPCRFVGESNTVYQEANGGRWTPHFYTRGNRLGFGALPFGDAVGWEPGDVFLAGVRL